MFPKSIHRSSSFLLSNQDFFYCILLKGKHGKEKTTKEKSNSNKIQRTNAKNGQKIHRWNEHKSNEKFSTKNIEIALKNSMLIEKDKLWKFTSAVTSAARYNILKFFLISFHSTAKNIYQEEEEF